jgi:tetratricopeptide (TPR) repeat protein
MRAAGGDTAGLELPARLALREAGARAKALSALDAAIGFYRRALDLWPTDDPGYPLLLLQLGEAAVSLHSEGEAELRDASELLLVAGDREGAALAESNLGELMWHRGRQQVAFAHFDRSLELIDGLPDTRDTAMIRAWAWRTKLLASLRPPLDEGKRILALLEEAGTAEDVFHARITLALGYAWNDHWQDALAELETVREDTLRANSYVASRACLNLASISGAVGDLRRCAEVHREGLEVARRFGSHFHARWLEAECMLDDFYAGEWDRARRSAEALVQHEGPALYMDSAVHHVDAAIALSRGDPAAARTAAAANIEHARTVGDPQVLWSSLGQVALVAVELGDGAQARAYVDELVGALAAAESVTVEVHQLDGYVAADALGMGSELRPHLAKDASASPWVDAAGSIVEGRLDEAGDVLHAHEAYAHAALVRLLAAERAGRETPGLRAATVFYERVGATAYLERAERLLQATA